MLEEKIKNSEEFSEEEKQKLLALIEKDSLGNEYPFPKEYTIDIGYDKDCELHTHVIKKNPGNIPDLEDCEYLLIMVKNGKHIIVDGGEFPNGWRADNTEEIALLVEEWEKGQK